MPYANIAAVSFGDKLAIIASAPAEIIGGIADSKTTTLYKGPFKPSIKKAARNSKGTISIFKRFLTFFISTKVRISRKFIAFNLNFPK